MPINFTLQEILGCLPALPLFALIFVAPGYVIGWLLDLFDFSRRTIAAHLVISIVLSMAVSPILLFLVDHFTSARITILLLWVTGIIFIIGSIKTKHQLVSEESKGYFQTALLIASGWIIFSILLLVDVQFGNRLYYTVVSYDLTTRVTIINAITRSGVPPINPSYFPGHPVLLTYLYYFWYIPGSIVEQIGTPMVSGYTAMIASVSWCGLALMATVALYLRLRTSQGSEKNWRSSLIGISLLLISGLDIIPAIILMISSRLTSGYAFLDGDIERWNEQITAWIGSVAWVPHHVAALIACLAAVMLIQSVRGQSLSKQIKASVVAGIAFASAAGLSVYVTLIFVIFWGMWMIVLFFQKERRLILLMALAGMIALIAASPFLIGIISGSAASASNGFPLSFAVRMFYPVYAFVSTYPPFVVNLILLLTLPINYLMELGFFFIAGMYWIQQHWDQALKQNPFYVSEIILLSVTFFIGSFIRSTIIANNDLGWRVWLAGQFVLLIWSADLIHGFLPDIWQKIKGASPSARIARQLKIFLMIGLLTSITDVVLLRTWPMLVDANVAGFPSKLSVDAQLGKRTFAARLAYDYINRHTPVNALIQDNPAYLLNPPIGLYGNRAMVVSGHTAYGVPIQGLNSLKDSVSKIFSSSSWLEIDSICNADNINIIVATDIDPIWKNLSALEQQRAPLYRNDYYAVFDCGNR
jgi:hypothetical protein